MTATPDAGRPRTAFILAAGHGERMRPLTDDKPKPLVPLAGRPLIDHVLNRLHAAGVERVVINVHYRADLLIAHLAGHTAPQIVISDEREHLLDTGGGVVKALPRLGAAPFFIHNSDTVWLEEGFPNLGRLAQAWDPERMDSLLLLAAAAGSIGYDGPGDFALGADGRLARRAVGARVPHVFAGVSIAHRRLFVDPPTDRFSLNLLWDRAIATGRLYGHVLDGLWMHVGTPAALAAAEERIAHGPHG